MQGASAMTSITAPLSRALPTVLLCLTLTGAAHAAASDGPIVGWGLDSDGQATPWFSEAVIPLEMVSNEER
jgi:hypothetical protein